MHAELRRNVRMSSSNGFTIPSVEAWETVTHGISTLEEGSRLPSYPSPKVTAHAKPPRCALIEWLLRAQLGWSSLAGFFSPRLLLVAFASGCVPAGCQCIRNVISAPLRLWGCREASSACFVFCHVGTVADRSVRGSSIPFRARAGRSVWVPLMRGGPTSSWARGTCASLLPVFPGECF